MNFPAFFLLLFFSFIPLWPEKLFYVISIFLNFLRHLWLNTWSILENVLCALENNVCSATVTLNVLLSPFGLNYSPSPALPYWFSVWMTCLLLKVGYWTTLLLLHCCIFLPWIFKIFAYILEAQILGAYINNYYILLMNWLVYHYIMNFFVSFYSFLFRVYFVWCKYSYLCSLGFHLPRISFSIYWLSAYVCP